MKRLRQLAALVAPLLMASALASPTQLPTYAEWEEQYEFGALKAYVTYYRVTNGSDSTLPMTTFKEWRYAAWHSGNDYVDTGYYRAICNTVAVAAVVKKVDAGNRNVDLDRAKDMLMVVMREYSTSPYGGPGWGYYSGAPSDDGQLHFTTGMVGYPCVLAAALLWDTLSGPDKATAATALRSLADRLNQFRTVQHYTAVQSCGNTASEEASSDASFLAAMSQFDRSHANSKAWRTRAQELMEWAFDNLANLDLDSRPSVTCAVPPDGIDYRNTASNHNMFPHPNYGLSVPNDVARAVLPWAAQGITVGAYPSGVNGITSLAKWDGNHRLYGGKINQDVSAPGRFGTVLARNVALIKGNSGGFAPWIPDTSDFTFQGRVYDARSIGVYADLSAKSYLGVSGVSDWGMGADFQNGAFTFAAWLDYTYWPTLGAASYNYCNLLQRQKLDSGYGYLPTRHVNGCGSAPQTSKDGWRWEFLPSTCNATTGTLVPFFNGSNLTLDRQVNTHFYLNSFSALNHVVGYLYSRLSPYWPKRADGSSGLPNLSQ